jgi:deoxyribonuclease-4
MYFGAHVSIAGGLVNAPLNAAKLGCEVFQFFSRSPQGGFVAPLNKEIANMFKKNAELCAQREWYIHTPYFISLASGKNSLWHGSVAVLREELERGSLLGARYVITHMGSYKDLGREAGFEKLIDGLVKVFDGYTGYSELLIEISAGSGDVIGSTFEEIGNIIHHKKLKGLKLGVCYDTQHGFASGYDIRDTPSVATTFKQFDSLVGLEKLKPSPSVSFCFSASVIAGSVELAVAAICLISTLKGLVIPLAINHPASTRELNPQRLIRKIIILVPRSIGARPLI